MCARCRRPSVVCYCAVLPSLATTTRIVILQHPRERTVPIGTARMATLCLPNAELHVGIDWSHHSGLAAALADPARSPILLYPGDAARDLFIDPPRSPVTLVVVDGTWSQAKTVVRDNPILRSLPRYGFVAPELSRYQIRREPSDAFCSTIEAVMHALGALEGDPARFRAMLAPFEAMVAAQITCRDERPQRFRAARPRRGGDGRRKLPPALAERYDDVVVTAVEANALPYAMRDGTGSYEDPIHLVAHHPASGTTFERIICPRQPLAPSTTFHCELSAQELVAGGTLAEALAGLARFVPPRAVFASWGCYPIERLRAVGASIDELLCVRSLAHHRDGRSGSLDDRARAASEPDLAVARGRAGRRVAAMARMIARWRAESAG